MSKLSVRIQEASTWKGILYVATATAIGFFPDLYVKITMAAFGMSGIIGILFSDSPYAGPQVEVATIPTPKS
jgi:hypothetical protein